MVQSAPELRWSRELAIGGVGAGLALADRLVANRFRVVPSQGLGSAEIDWSLDRDVVGTQSLSADRWSDVSMVVLLGLPLAAVAVTGRDEPGALLTDLAKSTVVYAEAMLIAQGITRITKSALGRPRPFAYLDAGARLAHHDYDVSRERTFRSMPSGHATSAWTSAATAMTQLMLRRPGVGWGERFGTGFLTGSLATVTSALRVQAGQHFPSDVMVGGVIGAASGVALPVLHRGARAMPTRRDWLLTAGGLIAGSLVGAGISTLY